MLLNVLQSAASSEQGAYSPSVLLQIKMITSRYFGSVSYVDKKWDSERVFLIQIPTSNDIVYVLLELSSVWAMEIVAAECGQCYFQVLPKGFVLVGAVDNANSSGLELPI